VCGRRVPILDIFLVPLPSWCEGGHGRRFRQRLEARPQQGRIESPAPTRGGFWPFSSQARRRPIARRRFVPCRVREFGLGPGISRVRARTRCGVLPGFRCFQRFDLIPEIPRSTDKSPGAGRGRRHDGPAPWPAASVAGEGGDVGGPSGRSRRGLRHRGYGIFDNPVVWSRKTSVNHIGKAIAWRGIRYQESLHERGTFG
jgi:hypothetical protein